MSDFPRLKYLQDDSTVEVLSGHEPTRATNGALRIRRLFSDDKRSWSLSYFLEDDQLDALMTHYAGNKDGEFNFFWPGDRQTYTASYVSAPQPQRIGPAHSRVRVQLMEA